MGESDKEVREVMDTPERSKNNQIAASISKFEDSPVFTFLNSLSPIKPVKSTHITQTINPLSFASLPSVFTSPHVTSLRESRFLRRHHPSDPSKPEFSSNAQTKIDTDQSNADATKQSGEEQEKVEEDCSKFVVDFPKEDCHRGPYGNEANVEGETEIDQTKEATLCTSCDWDNVISDTSELLIFESPDGTDPYKKSLDHGTCFYTQIENDAQNVQSMGTSEQDVEGNEPGNLSSQLGEGNEMDNTDNCDVIAGPLSNNPGENSDYEHLSGFYRGMRRRCLVFEMGGAHRKNSDENTGSASSLWLQSDSLTASNDHKMVKKKTGNESSCHLLPGIGLHLNALASTPKDYKIVNNDSSASGRLLIGPSLAVNFLPSTTNQEMVNGILPTSSLDIEVGGVENTVLPLEDGIQSSGYATNEEINQNSPKKKRRKAEQGGEGEACKRCNCKRSKCLKLYCECFAAGVYCVEPCACMDCFNKPIHEDTVLATRKQIESRNPLAFAPKVIRGSDSPSEAGDDSSKTPASARHKRGCNCKKSGCLKKYCECYQGGVGCSINCRCEGCRNAFGRKDGMEADAEEDEMDVTEKSRLDRSFQKTTIENELEQNTDSAPPATPLRIGRQSTQIPFSSKKKPPRSSFPSIASISGFHARQTFGKPSFFPPPPPPPPPPPKFDKQLETVNEDEMPDFLQGGSPVGGVETTSPNRKRVSPPHGVVTSTGLRSSRKLILQSIPSFPSLTQNQ